MKKFEQVRVTTGSIIYRWVLHPDRLPFWLLIVLAFGYIVYNKRLSDGQQQANRKADSASRLMISQFHQSEEAQERRFQTLLDSQIARNFAMENATRHQQQSIVEEFATLNAPFVTLDSVDCDSANKDWGTLTFYLHNKGKAPAHEYHSGIYFGDSVSNVWNLEISTSEELQEIAPDAFVRFMYRIPSQAVKLFMHSQVTGSMYIGVMVKYEDALRRTHTHREIFTYGKVGNNRPTMWLVSAKTD